HSGGCSNGDSLYLDDEIVNGVLSQTSGYGDAKSFVLNYGVTWDEYQSADEILYLSGYGSVIVGRTYPLGVKGWSFRIDVPDPEIGKKHIHINGPKSQHWSQNEDGSPHDQGKNSS